MHMFDGTRFRPNALDRFYRHCLLKLFGSCFVDPTSLVDLRGGSG